MMKTYLIFSVGFRVLGKFCFRKIYLLWKQTIALKLQRFNEFHRIDDQRAAKSSTTKKEDIENLLAQISGINGPNRRMGNQRVSLQELNSSSTSETPIINKSVNQSQSDSNLQKLKKKSKKVITCMA